MSKVKIIESGCEKKMCGTIPVGTYFTAHWLSYTGLFLMTYHGMIMVEDPNKYWPKTDNFEIYDYRPVDVEIHVKEQK